MGQSVESLEYEIACRTAEKAGRDKTKILQPDDLFFVVRIASLGNPEEFQDL